MKGATEKKKKIPELIEDQKADDGRHVGMTGARLQTDGDVTTASVDDALSDDSTKLGHHVFMFVTDHLHTHTRQC